MTISTSINFAMTRNDLISGALRLIGVAASGETLSSAQVVEASESLNLMVKGWQSDGILLFANTEATLFTVKSQATYTFPTANCTTSYTATAVATAGVLGDVNLLVDSITGVVNGQYVGVLLDDGTMHWTTVNGVPAGTTIVLADALPSAAAVGNAVYTYTTKIQSPLSISNLRVKNSDGNEIPFTGYWSTSRSEYMGLPNKTATGTPVMAYFDPQITNSTLSIWPTPDTAAHRIVFTYERTLGDFDALDDNPDFPQHAYNAIKWNLAIEIAPEYGVTPSNFVINKAGELRQALWNKDREMTSIYFHPDVGC